MAVRAEHAGWLTKLGYNSGKWQLRYFVLTATELQYFNDTGGKLKDCTASLSRPVPANAFRINTKTSAEVRSFYCYCENAQLAKQWILAITAVKSGKRRVAKAAAQSQPQQAAQQAAPAPAKVSFHAASAGAKGIDVRSQPWFCPDWSADKAAGFLADKAPGSFVVRGAPERKMDFVLALQAGGRVCNVLLRHLERDGTLFWCMHPSTHYFQHLYDLLAFCKKTPFTFKGVAAPVVLNLPGAAAAAAPSGQQQQASRSAAAPAAGAGAELSALMQELKAERDATREDGDRLETMHQKQNRLTAQAGRIFQSKKELLATVDTKVAAMIEKLEEKFAGLDVVAPIVERLALARKDNVAQMVEVQAQGVTLKEVLDSASALGLEADQAQARRASNMGPLLQGLMQLRDKAASKAAADQASIDKLRSLLHAIKADTAKQRSAMERRAKCLAEVERQAGLEFVPRNKPNALLQEVAAFVRELQKKDSVEQQSDAMQASLQQMETEAAAQEDAGDDGPADDAAAAASAQDTEQAIADLAVRLERETANRAHNESNLATQDEQLSLLQEMAQLTEGQRQATTQEAVGTVNDFLADLAKIKDTAGASLAHSSAVEFAEALLPRLMDYEASIATELSAAAAMGSSLQATLAQQGAQLAQAQAALEARDVAQATDHLKHVSVAAESVGSILAERTEMLARAEKLITDPDFNDSIEVLRARVDAAELAVRSEFDELQMAEPSAPTTADNSDDDDDDNSGYDSEDGDVVDLVAASPAPSSEPEVAAPTSPAPAKTAAAAAPPPPPQTPEPAPASTAAATTPVSVASILSPGTPAGLKGNLPVPRKKK